MIQTNLVVNLQRNATASKNRVRVKRGIKDITEVGKIVSFNGEPQIKVWNEPGICNDINGTDGTIFVPFMTEETIIRAFSPDLCRIINITFQNPSVTKGEKSIF